MLVNEVNGCLLGGPCGPQGDSELGLLSSERETQIQNSRSLTSVLALQKEHRAGAWAAQASVFGLFLHRGVFLFTAATYF